MTNKTIELSKRINPFGLRINDDLKEQLKSAAKYNERSLNAEILVRLRDSLKTKEKINEQKTEA